MDAYPGQQPALRTSRLARIAGRAKSRRAVILPVWAVMFSADVTVAVRGLDPRVLPLMVGTTVLAGVGIIAVETARFIVSGFTASTDRLVDAFGEDARTVTEAVSVITRAAEGAVGEPPVLAAVDGEGAAIRRSAAAAGAAAGTRRRA